MPTILALIASVIVLSLVAGKWPRPPKVYSDEKPVRYDESLAPLPARSTMSLNKKSKPRWFELRGGPTKRQIAENDYPLPRT